jgi:hypothetical protein
VLVDGRFFEEQPVTPASTRASPSAPKTEDLVIANSGYVGKVPIVQHSRQAQEPLVGEESVRLV